MQILALIFLCYLSACSSVNPPMQLPPVSIPYSSNFPIYDLVVEEIPFLADLDSEAEKVACTNAIMGENAFNLEDADRLRECQAYYTCFPVPAQGYMPAMTAPMYIGQKIVPGYLPTELKAQFTSALKGVRNFKLSSEVGTPTHSGSESYSIKAMLTEYNVSSNKDSSGFGGMGVGPMSILQMVKVEKTQKTGFVRFDIRIVDTKNGRIVSAFSVAGSATDAYVSETLFQGSISENIQFVPLLMHQATRAALNEGAKRIYAELTNK